MQMQAYVAAEGSRVNKPRSLKWQLLCPLLHCCCRTAQYKKWLDMRVGHVKILVNEWRFAAWRSSAYTAGWIGVLLVFSPFEHLISRLFGM